MNKERFMKDFNGEKIFSLEYDKETLKDMVLEKQEEIERLNNIIREVREYVIQEFDIEKICRQEKSLTICKKGFLEILNKGSEIKND